MSGFRITSRANPLIKELARLHKRREREATGRFLIEGAREVDRALAARLPFEKFLVAPDLLSGAHGDLVDRLFGAAEVIEVGASAFRAVSRRQHPDGILAVAESSRRSPAELQLSAVPLLVVAEHIEKPGNLGAILRSADGAGADALIATDALTDLENPNVIRASQGSVFSVPTAVGSVDDVITLAQQRSLLIVCLSPQGRDALWDLDLTGPVAVAIGNEHTGISPRLLAAGVSAGLPMKGAADSLNTSVAAAVALYEAVRQRS